MYNDVCIVYTCVSVCIGQASKPKNEPKEKLGNTRPKVTKAVKFSESRVFFSGKDKAFFIILSDHFFLYSGASLHHPEFDIITREKEAVKKREMKDRNKKLELIFCECIL